jgi:peptide/nickel transport system permease protein
MPMTVELTVGAMLFATFFGILLGIISALRHNSGVDVGTMVGANVGVSMPVFWLGLMLAYLFAVLLKGTSLWLPPSSRLTAGVSMPPLEQVWHLQNLPGFTQFFLSSVSNSVILHSLFVGKLDVTWDAIRHLILPSLAVGTIPLAIIARLTRSSLLDVLGQDYVRTARAKGLRERTVLMTHAMRNAMIPIVTIVGLQVGSLLSGAVLTETVFLLPGIGTQLVESIFARDYPVVQGFVVAVALVFASVNIIVDLSYTFLDPRIRAQ